MMGHLLIYFYIFIGGGLGSVLRYLLGSYINPLFGEHFPYGTLLINISGSLLMGLIAGYFLFSSEQNNTLRLFLTVGCLGGFTTFSTFSLDTVLLWQKSGWVPAIIYVGSSVIVSILALLLGLLLAHKTC